MSRKKPAKKATKKRAALTPPFPHYPEWSTAKFWSFIRSGLRAKWSRWPPKFAVLKNAQRPYKGPNPRQKHEYQCSECKHYFPQREVEVDHVFPAGTLKDYSDLPAFVQRLFVGEGLLRVLCKPCHVLITKEQRNEKDH